MLLLTSIWLDQPLIRQEFQVSAARSEGPSRTERRSWSTLAEPASKPREPWPVLLIGGTVDRPHDAAAVAVMVNARVILMSQSFMMELSTGQTVAALFSEAQDPFSCLVLAHGAGAGMTHRFMASAAEGLADRGVSTLRYQFPYMEAGSKRVDRPEVAHAAVRAAVATVSGPLPLYAGGKSFGARMTSQAQALEPLPNVRGMVFFGFPLHPAGKPSVDRAAHLASVRVPMLFLQGTRDALANPGMIQSVVGELGASTSLFSIAGADHSFHVPARSGRTDNQVLEAMLDHTASWMQAFAVRG